MDEKGYLNYSKTDNMEALKNLVDKGYFSWSVLEVNMEDKLSLINRVFPQLMLSDPLSILQDFENSYMAALRVVGDKSDNLFKQLDDIRSGEIWKKI